MTTLTRRVLTFAFSGFTALWAYAIVGADWIGRVLVVLEGPALFAKFVTWMLQLPWYVPAVISGVVGAFLIVDIARSWSPRGSRRSSPIPPLTAGDRTQIALPTAVQSLYSDLRQADHIYARGAEYLSGSRLGAPGEPDDVLNWIATLVAGKVPILGRREPSTTLAPISRTDLGRSHFTDGASFLRDNLYDQSIFWTDLAVPAPEFEKLKRDMLATATDVDAEISVLELFNRLWQRGGGVEDRMRRIEAFAALLRDKASLGLLTLYGRSLRLRNDRLVHLEALDVIPREHWRDFRIWWLDSLEPDHGGDAKLKGRSLDVYTNTNMVHRDRSEGYADLYVEKEKAERLLERVV